MAIYQFYLAVFPKDGVLKIKGEIPEKLEFNDLTGFFEENTENFWKESNINSQIIISELDKILPRANWGNDKLSHNWKLESDTVDNDAWIGLTNENIIQEFYLRFDLRQPKLKFLVQMLELGKKYNLMVNDYDGNLINPRKSEMKSLILKNQRAKSFVKDIEFFDTF